jgi:hypothetical protein
VLIGEGGREDVVVVNGTMSRTTEFNLGGGMAAGGGTWGPDTGSGAWALMLRFMYSNALSWGDILCKPAQDSKFAILQPSANEERL